jgi:hypothetical protein
VTDATSQSSQAQGNQAAADSAAANAAASSGNNSGTQNNAANQSKATRPDWVPETAWHAEKGFDLEAFGKHWTEKVAPDLTQLAAERVLRNSLPAKPEDYKTALSPAFKPPEGVEFKIDEADPLWAQAKTWAHANGLSQEAFAQAIDLVAGRDVATAAKVQTARNAEIAKLGPTGPARVDAIETFYKGFLGSEAEAKAEMSRIFTAADVQRHEKKIAKWATQGAASFSQSHRVPGDGSKVDEATWAKMSPAERWDYARSHDQSQFQKAS